MDTIIAFLKEFRDICHYVYPFPTGKLLIFGNEDSLKLVIFGYEVDNIESVYGEFPRGEQGVIGRAIEFLDLYLLGEIGNLPVLDLSRYTDRERKIYHELKNVGFGETVSYKDLSIRAGLRNASRFVGNTMAKNRFPIFIPCHRVILSNGNVGSYSAGRSIKRFLLEHERAITRNR